MSTDPPHRPTASADGHGPYPPEVGGQRAVDSFFTDWPTKDSDAKRRPDKHKSS